MMNDINMVKKEKPIEAGGWVYVGLFRGIVTRIRLFQGMTWVDVEIGGVVNPYPINEVEPEAYYEAD